MDSVWEDYYSILQVHFAAEPEVITGAYRLLSKKYHPDVNKNQAAEEKMKRLNLAYGILSDVRKRTLYNVEWMRHMRGIYAGNWAGAGMNAEAGAGAGAGAKASASASANTRTGTSAGVGSDRAAERAQEQIASYYSNIKSGDYETAYECISAYDKTRIKKADFLKWRETVAKTCELRNYSIDFFKTHMFMRADKKMFTEAYEFTVHICERDISNNTFSDYKTSKISVLEDGHMGVFLGYADIKPFISAFENHDNNTANASASAGSAGAASNASAANAAGVVDAKAMLDHWLSDQARHDHLTGMYNLIGFLGAAKSEVIRNSRHDSPFSIVVFEVKSNSTASTATGLDTAGAQNPEDYIIPLTGQFLTGALRAIDISCRWKNGKFIALLAETDASAAVRAANRICRDFNTLLYAQNKPEQYHTLYAGVSAYDAHSLPSTIKKCSINLAFAKIAGRSAVINIITRLRSLKPAVR